MSIDRVGGVGSVAPGGAVEAPKPRFSEALQQLESRGPVERPGLEAARTQAHPQAQSATAGRLEVEPLRAQHAAAEPSSVALAEASRAVERVGQAQERLDQILQLAESGKSFTPAELLAMQAHVYRASQEIDLASKVVDKATSGIKQVLQTNL